MRGIKYVYIDRKFLGLKPQEVDFGHDCLLEWFVQVGLQRWDEGGLILNQHPGWFNLHSAGKIEFQTYPLLSAAPFSNPHSLSCLCHKKGANKKKLPVLTFKFRTLLVVMIMVMVLIMDSFMGLVGGLEGESAKSQKSRFVSKFKSGSTHPTQGQLKITCIESISDVSNQLWVLLHLAVFRKKSTSCWVFVLDFSFCNASDLEASDWRQVRLCQR